MAKASSTPRVALHPPPPEALTILGRLLPPWDHMALTTPPEIVIRTAIMVCIVAIGHVVRGMGLLRWERLKSPVAVGAFWAGVAVLTALTFAPVHEPFIYYVF